MQMAERRTAELKGSDEGSDVQTQNTAASVRSVSAAGVSSRHVSKETPRRHGNSDRKHFSDPEITNAERSLQRQNLDSFHQKLQTSSQILFILNHF